MTILTEHRLHEADVMYMKDLIQINDLETRPSQETNLLRKLSYEEEKKVKGGLFIIPWPKLLVKRQINRQIKSTWRQVRRDFWRDLFF